MISTHRHTHLGCDIGIHACDRLAVCIEMVGLLTFELLSKDSD